ncbi:hypothetical protein SAMN05216338_102653 [Bradyrhizobium sp. Rc2d]|nr:hypothetical protein SAMN05216338_102653 [Bradyrhizobium sp. Rc2d]
MIRPLVVCVTRQAELERQPASASRSTEALSLRRARYGAENETNVAEAVAASAAASYQV